MRAYAKNFPKRHIYMPFALSTGRERITCFDLAFRLGLERRSRGEIVGTICGDLDASKSQFLPYSHSKESTDKTWRVNGDEKRHSRPRDFSETVY